MKENKPEKKFSSGAISATIWRNEGKEEKEFNTISVERHYQDKDGKWQNTSSMRVTDLPKVALVVTKAYEYLALKEEATA